MKITFPLSLVLVFSVAAQTQAATLPVKILHLGFDELSGNTVIDALGKGNDAMLIHEATRSKDVPPTLSTNRTSLELTGRSHVTAPRIDLSKKSFSLTAWVKTNDLAENQTLLSQGDAVRLGKGIVLRLTTMGALQFSFTGDHTDTPDAVLSPDKKWHHTAFTFDKDTRQRRIYVDGVMQASGTASGVYLGNGITDIGRLNTAPFGAEYWNGNLDDIAVYDGVLTPMDVAALAVRDENASAATSSRRRASSQSSESSSSSKVSHLIGRLERLTLRRALGKRIPLPTSAASSSSSSASSVRPTPVAVSSSSSSKKSVMPKPVASATSSTSSVWTTPSMDTMYRVTSFQLRVRLDSRATSKELLTLIKGDVIHVYSFLNNGWAKIRTLDGTEGYVHAGFIEQVQ